MTKLKAVYYVNQFYAGIGGEEKADVGLSVYTEKKGPAIGVEPLWNKEMEVVKVLVCGDNFINNDEKFAAVLPMIKEEILAAAPDVFVAGPAFNAGRYGVACAKICDYVKNKLGIPSVTGMWWENPAISMYVQNNYIVATTETASGMRKSLPKMAALALKLAKKEAIGPALEEGYLPTGHRYNEYHEKTGARRVTEILLDKLYKRPYRTEVPLRGFEQVPPAAKVEDMAHTVIALITTGGLVPVGNPDKLKQAFSISYGKYDMTNITTLNKGEYESIHGGYDTTDASNDPHRLIPLDAMRALEKEHKIEGIFPYFYTTCGVGTNVETSKAMGREIAEDLRKSGVQAAILTST
ncbi:glycine reductase [Muricomes intestini]|jgi:glycine reductase|uniref:Glycine reductase n=2 Tax=Muricomes intestini TaxID=1796634 RepID=A0A4R3KG40_9FIRM|nr:glycine reductase [Muricomes intestini]